MMTKLVWYSSSLIQASSGNGHKNPVRSTNHATKQPKQFPSPGRLSEQRREVELILARAYDITMYLRSTLVFLTEYSEGNLHRSTTVVSGKFHGNSMRHLTPVFCRVPRHIPRSVTGISISSAIQTIAEQNSSDQSVSGSGFRSGDIFANSITRGPRYKLVAANWTGIVRAMATESSTEAPAFLKPRKVVKTLLSKQQPEGDGATVRRSIGRPEMKQLDPFLLLDHFSVSPPAGFPDHPHRGFETVTYMLEGSFTHQDFAGHKGTIGPGDLQWMTAGRGIVHCEMPAAKGTQTGLQLWVNLAAKDKMVDPKYQELADKDIPKVEKDGVKVSVIAGESLGVKSPVYTRTPTMYLDFTMQPGASLHQAVPEGWNSFVYILEGQPTLSSEEASPIDTFHTVQLGPGDGLSVWNKTVAVTRFVLIAGQPLNEPVVQHGPFVMNTREEIMQTIRDYQFGTNGFERATGWESSPVQV